MSSNVVFNGTTYSIPADGDFTWGPDLTAYFIDIATGALSKTGGSFTLTAETDFGATYGLKSVYFKSRATNPASAGSIRLGNAEVISWRNAANAANLDLVVNASDALLFNSKTILFSALGLIVNADISASAAIAYSKLNLTGLVVNADIAAAAAIAYSKLAALTASRLLVSDGSGVVSVSAVTATEAGYLAGVTSAIQTQMNLKAPLASPTFTGTVTVPATITAPSAVVLTLPATTSTLATLALAETLSSKTLTSPQVNGLLVAKSAKTGDYTLLLTDDIVTCDSSGAAFTITFPAAATSTGKIFTVKKTDTSFNAVTMSGTGFTTSKLMTIGETAMYQSDGSAWIQIFRKTDTPWITYSLTIGATTSAPTKGTVVTDQARWRRKGDSIEVRYQYHQSAAGAAGTGSYKFPIPNSAAWTIDTAKVKADATNNIVSCVGTGGVQSTTEGVGACVMQVYDTTNLWGVGIDDSAVTQISAGNYGLNQALVMFSYLVTVPMTDFEA